MPLPQFAGLGGLGPESTIDYYCRIRAGWEREGAPENRGFKVTDA